MSDLLEPYIDDSHRAFRDICRRFAREQIAPEVDAWEEAGAFPKTLFRAAGQAGVLSAPFPESQGGGGGDVFYGIIAGEELMRGGSAGVVAGLGSLTIAMPPILALGTPEQQARFAAPAIAGDVVAALAITEPNTGSDVSGIQTRAVADGDEYVISGTKLFITSGIHADQLTLLARTGDDPHGGLSFFVVPRSAGYTVSRALRKTGWWASDTAELHFDEVRVPKDHLLGPLGSGFPALMLNFEGERLSLATNGTALATLALEEALAYARQRRAFGRDLVGFQVIRHKLARMRTAVSSAQALTYAVADQMRRGVSCTSRVAEAKNHASEVAREVCWEAVQIFGGMGYMRETRVERYARDARLLPIGGGTQEIMNEIIARHGLGL